MGLHGSTMFRLTWKRRITPSGRLICALRASALRTSGNAFGGWLTPTAVERFSKDEIVVTRHGSARRRYKNGRTSSLGLTQQVRMREGAEAGQVNPAWLAWLMGYPGEWAEVSVIPSCRPLPRGSSKHGSK